MRSQARQCAGSRTACRRPACSLPRVVAVAACSRRLEAAAEAPRTHRPRAEEEAAAERAAGTRRLGAVAVAEVACSRRRAAEVEAAEVSTLLRAVAGAVVAGPTFPSSLSTLQIRSWQPTQSFGRTRPASQARMRP